MGSLSIDQLREQLTIDRFDLDRECSRQPTLFEEAAELAAELKVKARVAKHNADVVRSNRSIEIRERFEKAGVKLTEKKVEAMLDGDVEVGTAKREQHAAERDALLAESVMQAFDHRRSMLNNITELIRCGYSSIDNIVPNERESDRLHKRIAHARAQKKRERKEGSSQEGGQKVSEEDRGSRSRKARR